MKVHANAVLGPAGRLALVKAIESRMTQKAAATAFCVAPATAPRCTGPTEAGSGSDKKLRRCPAPTFALQITRQFPNLFGSAEAFLST